MLISIFIIISCFLGVIVLILLNKLNRAIASLAGGLITYFTLLFIEGKDFSVIVSLLFGSQEDNFANLHSLILIISIMIIIQISSESGLFQFLAIKLIKFTKDKPIRLMALFCIISTFFAIVLNNILSLIIVIPLTIMVSRILNINPMPYILTEAVIVNIGATVFSISSIPNIIISIYANITFTEFFMNIGLLSFIILSFTLIFFLALYKKELTIPKETFQILKEVNIWNFVQNKKTLYLSAISLIILIISFILIPSSLVSPDIITLSIAITLMITTRLDPKEIIYKVDYELILYLLGIFIITGALEIIDALNVLSLFLSNIGNGDLLLQTLLVLWVSAFLSSSIDNIPITKVLLPVIGYMSNENYQSNQLYYSLVIGANWGDNLTPLGDNIIVFNIAEQHKRPVSFKQFFKLGFITTIYQLIIVTLYYILIFNLNLGLIIITIIFLIIGTIYLNTKLSKKNVILKFLENIRKIIIR